jgi:hypothetical protein
MTGGHVHATFVWPLRNCALTERMGLLVTLPHGDAAYALNYGPSSLLFSQESHGHRRLSWAIGQGINEIEFPPGG